MEHIKNNRLEVYILAGEDFDRDERERFELHLNQCAPCREIRNRLVDYYRNVIEKLPEPSNERDQDTAKRLFSHHRKSLPLRGITRQDAAEIVCGAIDAYAEVIEPKRRSIVRRLVNQIRYHPVRSVGATSLAGALLVFSLLNLQSLISDKNPAYARAKEEFLVAYNKDGQELWRKHVGVNYDQDYLLSMGLQPESYLATLDVDDDGRNEVVAVYGHLGSPEKRSVFCYDKDGKERWRYTFRRDMKFGSEVFLDDYSMSRILAGDFDNDGKVEVFALAWHGGYYPSAIIKINAADGAFLDEYWSPGCPMAIAAHDLDGDGITEILVAGQNNGYDKASLAVLDPRFLSGHSPAPPNYKPENVVPASEKYYILFPQSDIHTHVREKRSYVSNIKLQPDGTVLAGVADMHNGVSYSLMYYFSSSMRCVRVDAFDPFVKFHRKLEAEGKLKRPLNAQYFEDLRRGLEYWDGEKFVSEPVMNKRYVERMNLP